MLQRVQKIVVTMDVQKDAQITVPAVISGTNATVDSSKMSDALDKLAENGLLTVDASNSSSIGLSFTLPSADVRKLADKNVKLELITALGSMTLDAASLKGFGGGLFRPNAPITRERFVAILYRYAAYKGLQTTASASLSAFADVASVSLSAFADAASVSGWAVDAVRWAVGSGLMNGKNGRIDPAGLTTRAEAAALLHRCLA